MATEKNITMKQFNGTDYDTLYPKTVAAQIDDVYSKDETYPKSQLYTQSQLYTKEQILTDATKTLYGLGADAVPDDLFKTLGAELRVTTEAGAVVTASKDNVTISVTADSSGLAVFKILTFGTWTLKATVNGKTLEASSVIDAIAIFNVFLVPGLANASWRLISAIAETGNAASFWSVGDKKTIKLNGVSYTVQIIGFNHDDKTTGGKAGITFQLVDCLNDTYQMNSSSTNRGGWRSSEMRSRMSTFLKQLPSDLQSVIKAVSKKTSAGNQSSSIEATSDKLFLLSEVEIFGSASNSFSGEGSQYDWYKAGNTKVKKVNGSASYWWERSPKKNSTTNFDLVENKGSSYNMGASNTYGVSFAFCI